MTITSIPGRAQSAGATRKLEQRITDRMFIAFLGLKSQETNMRIDWKRRPPRGNAATPPRN
jgi:hypothetical protein